MNIALLRVGIDLGIGKALAPVLRMAHLNLYLSLAGADGERSHNFQRGVAACFLIGLRVKPL